MPEEIEFIARGLLEESGHVLLCRNRKHGYYFLPGGHIEFGESAKEALAREFIEECDVLVRVGELLLTHEHRFERASGPRHEVNVVFLVEREGGGSRGPADSVHSTEAKIAFEWIERSKLPQIDMRPASMVAWLLDLAARWVSEP